MNDKESRIDGIHRIILAKNNKITAILVFSRSPDIGYDKIYAQKGAVGINIIGPQFNNRSIVAFTCPDLGCGK